MTDTTDKASEPPTIIEQLCTGGLPMTSRQSAQQALALLMRAEHELQTINVEADSSDVTQSCLRLMGVLTSVAKTVDALAVACDEPHVIAPTRSEREERAQLLAGETKSALESANLDEYLACVHYHAGRILSFADSIRNYLLSRTPIDCKSVKWADHIIVAANEICKEYYSITDE